MATAKRMTKAQIIAELADKTGLTKKEITSVFDALRDLIKVQLTKRGGPGEFVIPDLLKLKVRKVAGRKAGMYPDPFDGGKLKHREAKPASKKVSATPLKKLKDLVNPPKK